MQSPFPVIHAHYTNGITLLATLLIVILPLLLPENYTQVVRRLDTTINTRSAHGKRSHTLPKVKHSQAAALLDLIAFGDAMSLLTA